MVAIYRPIWRNNNNMSMADYCFPGYDNACEATL